MVMAPVSKTSEKEGEPKQKRRPGRAPVSCAECRRLKLRCDRKIPCETCVKRGTSSLCPEGTLTTGRGSRLALADAEELHKKVERLRNRSAALEEALRSLQAAVCDHPHPLLLEDAMQVSPAERTNGSPTDGPLLSREDEQILDAFGTLTLGLRGESRFFGQTARSEYLIHAPTRTPASTSATFPHLSPELVKEAYVECDVPCNHGTVQEEVKSALPSLSQACHLCEIFMEYGQYIWYPVPRGELFDDILGSVYRALSPGPCDLAGTHAIGLLFMIFALATLFDPNMPPYAIEAHEYYLLSRICLRCAPPITDTTLVSIQTMIYMAQYLEMSDCEPAHTGSHKAWLQIGLAFKLGHSIGLHVNSCRWKLDDESSQKRGRVFWQLFMQDTLISFGFGRPPSMCLSFIDCAVPKDSEEKFIEHGQGEWGYHSWTWQYTKLLHTVMTSVFGARTPHYSTIIEFDRKIRDFPIPENLRPNCGEPEPGPPVPLYMQRLLIMSYKEATLLSLHRAFFTQALHEQPQDLLRHRYGPSVMAIYRSAWRVIEGTRDAYKRAPHVISRLGYIWSQSIAGGIVMCLLVTRAPTSPLAAPSLQELDNLCELFEQVAGSCQIASNNLDVVRKLRRRGHETMSKPRLPNQLGVIDRELDRLGGKTHLISSSDEPPVSCVRTNAHNLVTPAHASPSLPAIPTSSIHPTIMQDLRVFEGIDGSTDFAQFNLDLPSSSQQPSLTPTPDIFEELFGPQVFPLEQEPVTLSPPMLDSTWQSFVEQLGF